MKVSKQSDNSTAPSQRVNRWLHGDRRTGCGELIVALINQELKGDLDQVLTRRDDNVSERYHMT